VPHEDSRQICRCVCSRDVTAAIRKKEQGLTCESLSAEVVSEDDEYIWGDGQREREREKTRGVMSIHTLTHMKCFDVTADVM
jgi:hypothetical protein